MFGFKKSQSVFLAEHLPASKAYIQEHLVDEPCAPNEADHSPVETGQYDLLDFLLGLNQPKATPGQDGNVKYSLRDPDASYSLRECEPDAARDRQQEEHAKALRLAYMAWEASQRSRNTFSRSVLNHLEQNGISARTFYHRAGIDRKLFSKLKNDFCYQPNRETALRCCLALQLTVEEALSLLQSAGFTLSNASSFDLVIRYCLDNGIYDLPSVNTLLAALEEKVFV